MPRQHKQQKSREIPLSSWITASLGLALVIGTVGFLLYRASAGPESPPDLLVEQVAILPTGSHFTVKIRVSNRGGSAAAGVEVEGSLMEGSAPGETSAIVIDYVAAGSQRNAALIFTKDPRKNRLTLSAKGYVDP